MKLKKIQKLFLGILSLSYIGGVAYALTCGSGTDTFERGTVSDSEIYCIDKSGNFISSGSFTANNDVTAEDDLNAEDDLDIADDGDIDGELIIGDGIKLGDASTPTAVPSTTTGSSYGLKVPVFNASGGTIPEGALVITSTAAPTAAFPGYVTAQAFLSTTTWVGIADDAIASGAYGYAVVSGYAAAITTGVVSMGQMLVSTGTTTGGLGSIAAGTDLVDGSIVGIAVSSGPTTGGLTLIRIGR